jgi:hypothetical protein
MIGKFGEIVNAVEDSVDQLEDVILNVVEFYFLCFDLMRSDLPIYRRC